MFLLKKVAVLEINIHYLCFLAFTLGVVTYISINSNTQIDTSIDNNSNVIEVSDTIIKSTTTVPARLYQLLQLQYRQQRQQLF